MSWRRGWFVALALLLLSCGRPAPPPAEIAARAGQAMAQVQSFHFAITVEGGPAYIDPESSLSLRSMEGDLVRPDRVQARLKVGAAGLAVIELRFIGIGQDQFLTRPITGQWQPLPAGWGFDPTILFDPEQGIEAVLKRAQWQAQVGEERVGKARCYHLHGSAQGKDMAPITAWTIVAEQVEVEAWVGKGDSLLYQLRITEPPQEEGGHPIIWLLAFSAFDQPVTIERPAGL